MGTYYQQEDITVFGVHVKTFPDGIKEAFDRLIGSFGNRTCYGISWLDEDDKVQYYAMLPETFKGEAKQYHLETLSIKKGEYHATAIYKWISKLNSLKNVFHGLMPNNSPDKNHPCIEWYKSDDELLCMIQAQ